MKFGKRNRLAIGSFLAAAALFGVGSASDSAFAQSAECGRLQAAIASAPRGGGASQAALERERAQLAQVSAYSRSAGCDNQKFLFFGSDPPPQCRQIKGQIAQLQASVADLQARAGGGGGRADLIARYNAECANAPRQPTNIFEALFGGGRPQQNYEPVDPTAIPPDQQRQMIENSIEKQKGDGVNAHAGSYAVCVKTCDGSFFPVSYSGAGSRSDSLEDVCRSVCPNADTALYSFPFGGTINEAMSPGGERYVDLPNALKYLQSFDSSCSCRRRGESWAQTLAGAEAKYGHEAKDILVTPEKSAEMSRPVVAKTDPKAADAKAKGAKTAKIAPSSPPEPDAAAAAQNGATDTQAGLTPGQSLDANGTDTALSAAAATVSRETSGIAGGDSQTGANYGLKQGQTLTEQGPDGAKRKVRIVGPTL
jgi:hypothetical protein